MRRLPSLVYALSLVTPGLGIAQTSSTPQLKVEEQAPVLRARIVAVGIPQASAVAEIGTFHPGGPIHDVPGFAEYTKSGNILDPKRLLVTSGSNFGAPLALPDWPEGSVLSIEPTEAPAVVVPPDFAARGDQASVVEGRVKLFSAQSPQFLNGVNTPGAATAHLPAVSNPLGISINNAFGRLWFPSAPTGSAGFGTDSILDPGGQPLANAPSKLAGGLFAGDLTNRREQFVPGGLRTGAIANAFLGASPDGGKRAVFAVVTTDGALAQMHTEKDVDGLAPAETIASIQLAAKGGSDTPRVTRAGIVFNWTPDRILYVSDPVRNAIAVLLLTDDGNVFKVKETSRITSPRLNAPVDLAPAISEIANPGFSSNTTLAAASDLYVLNRGDGTIIRMRQNGDVIAVRRVASPNGSVIGSGQLNGIAVSRDAAKIWLTVSGVLPEYPDRPGAVLEVPAFGPGRAARLEEAPSPKQPSAVERGAERFGAVFSPAEGLGPLFNGQSCATCHIEPTVGGMGPAGLASVLRVGRTTEQGFDSLAGRGGPVSRAHSVAQLGIHCGLEPGIPAEANVVSLRNTPPLYGAGLIDAIPDEVIWPAGTDASTKQGRPHRMLDVQGRERIGRFGWKADVASLEEFVGIAFRNELGITNPFAPDELVDISDQDCEASRRAGPKDDGTIIRDVARFVASLPAPAARNSTTPAEGLDLFTRIGCAQCHTPSLRLNDNHAVPLYSDLLLHDMGPRLDDGVIQGNATGRDWRTTPLWGLGNRTRFLHDGSATTIIAAVLAHEGEAAKTVAAFRQLSPDDRGKLLGFLSNL